MILGHHLSDYLTSWFSSDESILNSHTPDHHAASFASGKKHTTSFANDLESWKDHHDRSIVFQNKFMVNFKTGGMLATDLFDLKRHGCNNLAQKCKPILGGSPFNPATMKAIKTMFQDPNQCDDSYTVPARGAERLDYGLVHPTLEFKSMLRKIHVKLTNIKTGEIKWNASYDLKNNFTLLPTNPAIGGTKTNFFPNWCSETMGPKDAPNVYKLEVTDLDRIYDQASFNEHFENHDGIKSKVNPWFEQHHRQNHSTIEDPEGSLRPPLHPQLKSTNLMKLNGIYCRKMPKKCMDTLANLVESKEQPGCPAGINPEYVRPWTFHPSFLFDKPQGYIRVMLQNTTTGEMKWDAIYNLRGKNKLSALEAPADGNVPFFYPNWCRDDAIDGAQQFELKILNLDSNIRPEEEEIAKMMFTKYGSQQVAQTYQPSIDQPRAESYLGESKFIDYAKKQGYLSDTEIF